MKRFVMATLLLLSLSATAEVIKPIFTSESASGVVYVGGVQFDYSVTDRGWQTHGNLENGRALFVAEKSFLLSYEGKNPNEGAGIEAALDQDGQAKCQELGEIEYAEQIKGFADYSTSLKAEITSSRAVGAANGFSAWATFICLVTVEANK